MITLQADFTDQPEHLPELIKRFEGGADIVVAERTLPADDAARRCAACAGSRRGLMRAVGSRCRRRRSVRRAAALSHLAHSRSDQGSRRRADRPAARAGRRTSICSAAPRRSRAASRRCELEPRYDVRARESRIRPWSDGLALFRVAARRARAARQARRA